MALLNSREREAIEQSWLLTSMPTSQLSDENLDYGTSFGPPARGRGRSPPRDRPISPEERKAAAARRSMSPTMRKAQDLASRDHVLHVLMARRAATARLRQLSVAQASQASQAPGADVQPSSEWDVPHWMAASVAMADKAAATMSSGRRSLADLAAMASMLRQSQVRSSSPWLRTIQSELGEAEAEQQEQQISSTWSTWGNSSAEQVQGDGGQDSQGGAKGRPGRKLQQMMSRRSPSGRVRAQGLAPGGCGPQKRRPAAAQSVAQFIAQHAEDKWRLTAYLATKPASVAALARCSGWQQRVGHEGEGYQQAGHRWSADGSCWVPADEGEEGSERGDVAGAAGSASIAALISCLPHRLSAHSPSRGSSQAHVAEAGEPGRPRDLRRLAQQRMTWSQRRRSMELQVGGKGPAQRGCMHAGRRLLPHEPGLPASACQLAWEHAVAAVETSSAAGGSAGSSRKVTQEWEGVAGGAGKADAGAFAAEVLKRLGKDGRKKPSMGL